MSAPERIRRGAHLHAATRHGGLVFLSGLVAEDREAPFCEQVRQIFSRADKLLAEAGSGRGLLLAASVYILDQGDKAEFNRLWLDWLGDDLPARTTVGVASLGTPSTRIEITFTAAAG
jgi:enamine deaminase RidA (YjgF/YER057c/UK114 family)